MSSCFASEKVKILGCSYFVITGINAREFICNIYNFNPYTLAIIPGKFKTSVITVTTTIGGNDLLVHAGVQ
mgnify:FL=1